MQTHASWLKRAEMYDLTVLRSEVQNEAKAKLWGEPGSVGGVWPHPTLQGYPTPTFHPPPCTPSHSIPCQDLLVQKTVLLVHVWPCWRVPSQGRPLSPPQGLGGGGAASGGEDEAQHEGGGGPRHSRAPRVPPVLDARTPDTCPPASNRVSLSAVARDLEWARSHIFLMLMN